MGAKIEVKSEKVGKRRKKGGPKSMQKNDAKFGGVQTCKKSNLGHQREDFGAGGEVRRGQAPPGPAISASIQFSI